MSKAVWLFASSAVLIGCTAVSMPPTSTTAADLVVPEIARQFSACNLNALLENYSADVEFVSPSTPMPLIGRSELREHFSGACGGLVRPVMRVEAQRVRMLSPAAAVITGTYGFGRTDRPDDRPWTAFFVVTLRQSEGRWLVATQATFPLGGS